MKFVDNRQRSGTFEDFGHVINAFEYEKIGSSSDYDYHIPEYGINTSNGYTLSLDEDELVYMLDMIKKIKLQKQKESMLK